MRTVRKYYQEEYQKAIEKRKNRLARDYAIAAVRMRIQYVS